MPLRLCCIGLRPTRPDSPDAFPEAVPHHGPRRSDELRRVYPSYTSKGSGEYRQAYDDDAAVIKTPTPSMGVVAANMFQHQPQSSTPARTLRRPELSQGHDGETDNLTSEETSAMWNNAIKVLEHRMSNLSAPHPRDESLIRRLSKATMTFKREDRETGDTFTTALTKPSRATPPDEPTVTRGSRISTTSWSRFPSHNRGDRSSSAGAPDGIETRDFGSDSGSSRNSQQVASGVAGHESGRGGHLAVGVTRDRIKNSKEYQSMKRRSMYFGKSILHGLGRMYRSQSMDYKIPEAGHRSSVATAGVLEYPELEVLPPDSPILNSSSSDTPTEHEATTMTFNKQVHVNVESRDGSSTPQYPIRSTNRWSDRTESRGVQVGPRIRLPLEPSKHRGAGPDVADELGFTKEMSISKLGRHPQKSMSDVSCVTACEEGKIRPISQGEEGQLKNAVTVDTQDIPLSALQELTALETMLQEERARRLSIERELLDERAQREDSTIVSKAIRVYSEKSAMLEQDLRQERERRHSLERELRRVSTEFEKQVGNAGKAQQQSVSIKQGAEESEMSEQGHLALEHGSQEKSASPNTISMTHEAAVMLQQELHHERKRRISAEWEVQQVMEKTSQLSGQIKRIERVVSSIESDEGSVSGPGKQRNPSSADARSTYSKEAPAVAEVSSNEGEIDDVIFKVPKKGQKVAGTWSKYYESCVALPQFSDEHLPQPGARGKIPRGSSASTENFKAAMSPRTKKMMEELKMRRAVEEARLAQLHQSRLPV
ncbi:MAG: hypothetical protein M1817_003932 [Caeruleum heppii]|nr:MAG: hypothetical protein M1817_003932 [Caeruleum heppii]